MTATNQAVSRIADHAARFRALHSGSELLILPNAWDAGSARLMERLGAKAIATTSAGVAWSHGYPDGDALPLDCLLSSVAAIRRVTTLPLTVDVEGGYAADPAEAAGHVARVAEAGAVGINIEDGAGSPDLLRAKLAAIRRRLGPETLFINVRTDVYLRGLVPAAERLAATLERARHYREAGADGLFVPGVTGPGEIRTLAAEAGLPLNVLAWPGLPPAAELAGLGVRRLSAGSAIAQALWGEAAALGRDFLEDGCSEPLQRRSMGYAEVNGLFTA